MSIEEYIQRIADQSGVDESDVRSINNVAAASRVCHQLSFNAGWWSDLETGKRKERCMGEIITLIHSEITEAFEGYRKDLMDDKLPHRKMLEVELADAKIRIYDMAGGFGWEIMPSFVIPNPETTGKLFAEIHLAVSRAYEAYDRIRVVGCLSRVLRLIDSLAARHNCDIESAMIEKMAYNLDRADHKREARLAAGGKKC